MTKQDFTLEEPVILALDTSSRATSIAVTRGASVLASVHEPPNDERSDTLWTDVGSLLSKVAMTIADVDVFAVCTGPGGFTGLRIGVAAAKGFAVATSQPVVGITSLEAAAFSASPAVKVCALVSAYKGEVYSQLFSFGDDGAPVAGNDPLASSLEIALDRLGDEGETVFAGAGAEAGADVINGIANARGHRSWTVKQSHCSVAEDIARLAFLKHQRGEVETAESLAACYVRRPEAEIKLSLGLLGSKIKRSMKAE